jgi:hypothetical protein
MLFASKWMELENIMLNKVSQGHKVKSHMYFSHIWKLYLQVKGTCRYIYDHMLCTCIHIVREKTKLY